MGRGTSCRMIEPKGINHIGIAVRSIEAHRAFYERTLGARFDGIEEVPSQHVRVAFFVVGSPGREVRLELVEADLARGRRGQRSSRSAARGCTTRLRRGPTSTSAWRPSRPRAFGSIDEQPREGAHGTRIAFLHPKSTAAC